MQESLTGPLAGVPVAVKDNMCTEGVCNYLQFENPFKL